MIIQAVTVVCLAILVIELIAVLANTIVKKHPQRIAFLRGFKKGKCAIIYVTAIPLYCIGHLYRGDDFLNAFFTAVNKIINLVVLKYDSSSIELLMNDSAIYRFTVYFCFVLVGLNALIFTISLIGQHIFCGRRSLRMLFGKKERLILFGNNKNNIAIYKSDKKRVKMLIDDISDKEGEELYIEKVAYFSSHSFETPLVNIIKLVEKKGKDYTVVVNTGADEKNIAICRTVINEIKKIKDDGVRDKLFLHLRVLVFGDPRYQAVYEDIVAGAHGCIRYINKYQKIAMDFIDRYPLAKFMDQRQIDYDSSLIRPEVDINVLLVGFGLLNQQIFLTSVANNQFLTRGDKAPELKPVKYHIIDKKFDGSGKKNVENNKNLNHSYYRFKHECSDLKKEEYLPMPTIPAEETYVGLGVDDQEFYNYIRSVVKKKSSDSNFIVIAFGSDLENVDMAQKLAEKRREWGVDDLVIFVASRKLNQSDTLLDEENCFFISNDNETVYDIEKLLGDKIYRMAKMRNEVYDLEYDITHKKVLKVDKEYVEKNREKANKNWYRKKSQMERDSSLYSCLSLRSKLNLMGLDYCSKEEKNVVGLDMDEYLRFYAREDMPDDKTYDVKVNGKTVFNYTLEFPDSRRKNMAIHEHQRWNSFMISKGIVPASIEQIKTEKALNDKGEMEYTNGKNYVLRRHGNLTTFEGLELFRKIVVERNIADLAENDVNNYNSMLLDEDVIKYDYQLLDDAHWLLDANGYKIFKIEREASGKQEKKQ